jgi:hypothetical protein
VSTRLRQCTGGPDRPAGALYPGSTAGLQLRALGPQQQGAHRCAIRY